jgi:hypothetical protein
LLESVLKLIISDPHHKLILDSMLTGTWNSSFVDNFTSLSPRGAPIFHLEEVFNKMTILAGLAS